MGASGNGTIFGGWQLNGLFAAIGTVPADRRASLNMPATQTPDQVKITSKSSARLVTTEPTDTTAFKRVTEVRFGNVGRNTMRGRCRQSDLSLSERSNSLSGQPFRRRHSTRPTPRISATRTNSANFGRSLGTLGVTGGGWRVQIWAVFSF
jgi:hypothetical protein